MYWTLEVLAAPTLQQCIQEACPLLADSDACWDSWVFAPLTAHAQDKSRNGGKACRNIATNAILGVSQNPGCLQPM